MRLAALLHQNPRPDEALVREALEADEFTLRELASWSRVPQLAERARAVAANSVTLLDPSYPERLRQIDAPPLLLHCDGDPRLLSASAVAIVGSRRATPYGSNVARRFAARLARAGLAIVSGFARGIDAIAHQTSLEEGGGTVAVLGTGIDIDYPAGQARLRSKIAESGLLVSEFASGTPPRPANFPIRNRIIAGLVRGVVVIEAGLRSGSLVTARLALENNRDVWAVPGSVLSGTSAGCHMLIQQGARLVTSPDDVLEDLGIECSGSTTSSEEPRGLTSDASAVWQQLSPDAPLHVDVVACRLKWQPPRLAAALLELELSGMLRREAGGGVLRYVR